MKIPVIIPSYDEAEHIGATLRRLDAETTEPFVIVNGEHGARETAEAAQRYTPHVYRRSEQGKLPAIQFGLRKIRDYNGNDLQMPLLCIDADTYPLFPKEWARTMSAAAIGHGACSVAGVLFYGKGIPHEVVLRNARRALLAFQDRNTSHLRSAFGANMALNFGGDAELFDTVQALPHIWPSEDRYLFHLLGGEGDRPNFTQLAALGSAVITSSRYMPSLVDKLKLTKEAKTAAVHQHYAARRAQSVTHFFDEANASLRAYPQKDL